MISDFEPNAPPSNLHPTIYMVRLGVAEGKLWEASRDYREQKTDEWRKKALVRGKKTVEVHGRYCQLAAFSVEETS